MPRRLTMASTVAPRSRDEVDGAVGVGGGAGLADGDHERVAHVRPQPEAGQLGGGERLDPEPAVRDAGEQRAGQALAGDVGGALADHLDAVDARRCAAARGRVGASTSSPERRRGARRRARRACRGASCGSWSGASVISLRRKCGYVAAVDVAGGDLRVWRSASVTGSTVPS